MDIKESLSLDSFMDFPDFFIKTKRQSGSSTAAEGRNEKALLSFQVKSFFPKVQGNSVRYPLAGIENPCYRVPVLLRFRRPLDQMIDPLAQSVTSIQEPSYCLAFAEASYSYAQ